MRTDAAPSPAPLPPALAARLPGTFLAFEGPDGSGKSTQLKRFTAACRASGIEPVEVREPGGTEIGERIRDALLRHLEREDMTLRCEMLLYMASRAQLCETIIRPALASGRLVIADRFVGSTLAYQGTAGGLPESDILAAAAIATGGLSPQLELIFDVDERTAAARMNPLLRGDELDRMEAKGAAFHRLVRRGYHDQAARWPDRCALIDAAPDEHTVWATLLRTLAERLTAQ